MGDCVATGAIGLKWDGDMVGGGDKRFINNWFVPPLTNTVMRGEDHHLAYNANVSGGKKKYPIP